MRTTRRTVARAVLDPQTAWTRHRLQALLAVTAAMTLAILVGGVWSVTGLLAGDTDSDTDSGRASQDPEPSAQDRLASSKLAQAPLEAAQPGRLSSGTTGTLTIPVPTEVGAVGVATGFPRTPEGALAQLAAIDATALSSASIPAAQDVIESWAAPGGPTAETWSGVHAVAALLESAGMTSEAQGDIAIVVEPKMGYIKGTVGSDFVVPCIDFIVSARLVDDLTNGRANSWGSVQGSGVASAPQVAAADCQRMVWHVDRWLIGPGAEPAPAPSLWPGSQASFDAGYQWLEVPQS